MRSLSPCDDTFEPECVEGFDEFESDVLLLATCPPSTARFPERLPVSVTCQDPTNPFEVIGVKSGARCATGNQGEPVCTELDTCEDHLQCLSLCKGGLTNDEAGCEAECAHHVSPDSNDLALETRGCLDDCGDSETCVLLECRDVLSTCLDDNTD